MSADDVSFQELGNAGDEGSLDTKLRTALSKLTTGDSFQKNRELCDMILSKTEELQLQGRLIAGRQMLHIVRPFYEVRDNKRITFDLRSVMDDVWLGDAKLAQWKNHWDDMVRNQRSPLTEDQLREIYIEKIRSSDDLRIYVEHYTRLPEDHPEKTYRYLSENTDKFIREKRQRQNLASLSAGANGGVKKVATPGTVPPGKADDPSPGQNPPKGKGKGKDDTSGTPKVCMHHFFACCKDVVNGKAINNGEHCYFGVHRAKPTDAQKESTPFKKLEARFGEWSPGKFKYDKAAAPAKPKREARTETIPQWDLLATRTTKPHLDGPAAAAVLAAEHVRLPRRHFFPDRHASVAPQCDP